MRHSTSAVALAPQIQRAIQEHLVRGLGDPRLDKAMLTVTEVAVSIDVQSAKIFVSVMPEKAEKRVIAALRHAAAHLRRKIGDSLDHASLPQLTFIIDDRIKKHAAIVDALGQVTRDREFRERAKAEAGGHAESTTSEADPSGPSRGAPDAAPASGQE